MSGFGLPRYKKSENCGIPLLGGILGARTTKLLKEQRVEWEVA
jgi:hypothetical protein